MFSFLLNTLMAVAIIRITISIIKDMPPKLWHEALARLRAK